MGSLPLSEEVLSERYFKITVGRTMMTNTIKHVALSLASLSSAGMAYAQETNVEEDTGLPATLDSIPQQVENGSVLNLEVNTSDVDPSVDLAELAGAVRE